MEVDIEESLGIRNQEDWNDFREDGQQ